MRIVFFLLLLSSAFINAQVTIVKRNGEKLAVKLIEVNTNEVRFKRFDYQDGPLFTLAKQEIKTLLYANGANESFENYIPPIIKGSTMPIDLSIQPSGRHYYYKEKRISELDMLAIAGKQNDNKINLMIKQTNQIRFVQNTLCVSGIALFGLGAYLNFTNRPPRRRRAPNPAPLSSQTSAQRNGQYFSLVGLGLEVVSFSITFDRIKHAHIVTDAYNKFTATSSH